MKQEDEALVTVMIIIVFLVSIVFGIGFLMESISCSSKAKIQGLQYSYGIVQGCMVREKDGKWLDYEKYRIMD